MERWEHAERGWLRSAAGRVASLLLGAGLAVTLAGCGDAPSDNGAPVAAATSTAVPSEPVAARPYPDCAEVWRTGQRLPAGYRACRAGGAVVHDRRRSCSSGQVLVVHRTRWYAVLRGPVNRVAGAHPARRMRSLLRTCTG